MTPPLHKRAAFRVGAAGVVVLAGVALVLWGPAGPWVVGSVAQGAHVWRLGSLHVDGISGMGLGDLRVAHLTLRDAHGVWAKADDVRLRWRPGRLLWREAAVDEATIQNLIVLRKPVLEPEKEGRGDIDVAAPKIAVNDIALADGVAGPAARLSLAGGVTVQRDALQMLRVVARRKDRNLDSVDLDFNIDPALALTLKVEGAPNGVIANWFATPNDAVHIVAKAGGAGKKDEGEGDFEGRIAAAPFAIGHFNWVKGVWRANADFHADLTPGLHSWTKRLGSRFSLSASGEMLRPAGAPFEATVEGEVTNARLRGRLGSGVRPVGAVALQLESKNLHALTPELGFESGRAKFDGVVNIESDRTRLTGQLAVNDAPRSGITVNAAGPVEVNLRAADIRFSGKLAGGKFGAPEAVRGLFERVTLDLEGRYDRKTENWDFPRLVMTGPNAGVAGAGKIDDSGSKFSGSWTLPKVGVLVPRALGSARGVWRTRDDPKSPLTMRIEGAMQKFGGIEPFGPLFGNAPTVDADLHFADKATIIDSVRVLGARVRLGGRGKIVGDRIDMAVETSVRGPANIAAVTLAGGGDATGTLSGALGDPELAMTARFAQFDFAGADFDHVTANVKLWPARRVDSGRLRLDGFYAGLPASADGRITIDESAVAYDDIVARLSNAEARGGARIVGVNAEAKFTLGGVLDGMTPGVTGPLSGAFAYSAVRDQASMSLHASTKGAHFGAIYADTASVSLSGALEHLTGSYAVNGWTNDRPFALSGEGEGAITPAATMMRLGLSGKVDQSDIVATEPIDVRWTRAQLVASGAVRVGDGSIEGVWRGDKEKLSVDATLADVPLIALTAMLDQPLAGTLSGKIHMAGAKKNLAGDANLTFAQARFARRSRDPLDGHLTAHLGDGVLQAQLDAQSAAGLKASASAKIPMVAEAAPFRLVPQSGGVLDAEWRVAGPVDGLWTLFGPLDQSLGGQVNGEGRVRFAGGGVTGAGKLALSAGSFEDKLSGVKLRNIASTISFDDQGMTLDHLSATDVNGGSLTGSGRLNGKDDGKLSLSLRNVRLVDRPDARATGNGDLALEWRPTGATLTGRIDLIEAEARGGAGAVTSPAEIDVVEVNRPGPPSRPKAVATSAINAKLDIRVVALGRVFTRTRGLDAEWSMDVRLAGDVNTPLVFGEARLLRGDFNLGGRRFDLDKGEIKFSGAPENAEVDLTATANSQDLTAHVTMTGPVLDPKIELSSEPALPEDEILPQLLFGRSAQDLSALEAAQLAASLASLAGKSAFDIAGAARAAVALDRLEVRQDGVGVLVAGGKYLTREVYVEVSRNALGRTATSVEWQIRPRLFVIPSFLANGDQRLAVRWRQDY